MPSKTPQPTLRDGEAPFQVFFERAPIGLAHADPEGKFIRVNAKFCELVGYTADELLRLSFQHITHTEDLGRGIEAQQKLLAGESDHYATEKRYVRKDGTTVWA